MSITRIFVDPDDARTLPKGQVDFDALDRTTETDIAKQKLQDDIEAARGALRYARQRLALSKADFAIRLGVSEGTLREWEHGTLDPATAAKALQSAFANAKISEQP